MAVTCRPESSISPNRNTTWASTPSSSTSGCGCCWQESWDFQFWKWLFLSQCWWAWPSSSLQEVRSTGQCWSVSGGLSQDQQTSLSRINFMKIIPVTVTGISSVCCHHYNYLQQLVHTAYFYLRHWNHDSCSLPDDGWKCQKFSS